MVAAPTWWPHRHGGDRTDIMMVATAPTWWRPHRHGDSSRLLLMEAHDPNALHRKHLLTCGMSKMIMPVESKPTQYAMIMEAIASGTF
jgi:hypothetical protein